jgi:CheY-like chemotaxis protein
VPTVLIIEDEWVIADALKAGLSDAGYKVVTAANGKIALDRLTESVPDVILCDFMMPVMNGAATIRAIQENPALRDIPIICMSSLPESRVATQVGQYRAFLAKPFTAARVLSLLSTVLAKNAP